MAADVVPYFRPQFLDADANPLVGGKVYTYKAGTTTPLVTYRDANYTPNTNPIILDASGSADIFIGIQAVKFVICDANDVTIKTIDNVTGANGSAVGIQTVVPITTDGVETTFALGVDAEVPQNCTVVLDTTAGDRIVYLTTEYSIDGQTLVFDTAPPAGTGEVRVGSTRAISGSVSDGAISTSKLQDLAVTNAKIATNSISTSKLQDGSVTNEKIEVSQRWALSVGDIKMHHSYNGAAPIGHGWMLCDGRLVTESNYDSEHGAGSWSTYIQTSPILNKYLPNMTNRYPVGKASTTQTGASAITAVGNSSHAVNLSHTHVGGMHNHQWYQYGTTSDSTFDGNGSPTAITSGRAPIGIQASPGSGNTIGRASFPHMYTSYNQAATSSSLSSSQSIQPDSIEVQYYMRII